MLEFLLFVSFPRSLGMFFRARALFEAYYWFLVELLLVTLLTGIPSLCYESKLLGLDDEVTLNRVYTRELNGEFCTE